MCPLTATEITENISEKLGEDYSAGPNPSFKPKLHNPEGYGG